MLLLLSPAKTLDYDTAGHVAARGTAPFGARSAELIEVLRQQSPQDIAQLMGLSDTLAALNVGRYGAWSKRHTAKNSKAAALAFAGDVYGGLDANSLSEADLDWAQSHVGILSGLYGLLRPLDALQPYRLEMGTRLATAQGKDLYAFWGDTLAKEIDKRLKGHADARVVNLASQEYFRAVAPKALKAPVLECVFEDWKAGQWKVISFFAKRARGLMARHAIVQRAERAEDLLSFDADGYAFAKAASSPQRWVFRRKMAAG
jgi:cytoplasmic iron level regulating protein YaaA (DUF328/UPF0246 family)